MATTPAEEQLHQRSAVGEEQGSGGEGQQYRNDQLKAHGVAHTVVISLAVKLGGEDARPGYPAEDRQLVYKQQLIGDGDGGHGFRTQTANHKIIQ